MLRQDKKNQQGFNLVEAAIVLGVTGLVIGGIWVGAAAASENMRVSSTVGDVMHIVERVRSMSTSTLVGSDGEDVTPILIRTGAIPAGLVRGTSMQSPWGTNGQVVMGATAVYVAFDNMPKSSCVRLLMAMSANDVRDGLSSTVISGPSGENVLTDSVSLQDASDYCEDDVTISWNYSLTGFKQSPDMGGGMSPAIGYDPPISLAPETM